MDGSRFDELARVLASRTGSTSRRGLLRGALAAVAVALTGRPEAEAAGAPTCPTGQIYRRGLGCVCRKTGRPPGSKDCNGCVGNNALCDGACVDSRTDRDHCGGCDQPCRPRHACETAACVAGSCRREPVSCPPPGECQAGEGVCDPGTGLCGYASRTGEPCGLAATCQDGVQTAQGICDAGGACQPGVTVSCAPYRCDDEGTGCGTTCRTDADCPPDLGLGQPCDEASDCTGELHCVEGVCCDRACIPCGTCTLLGSVGTCIANPVTACPPCHACDLDSGQCLPADGGACQPDNACFSAGSCQGGACVGTTTIECPPRTSCELPGTCNPSLEACEYQEVADGTACTPDGGGEGRCCDGTCCASSCCAGSACGPTCTAPFTFDPVSCACVCSPERACGTACCAEGTSCADAELSVCCEPGGTACPDGSCCSQCQICHPLEAGCVPTPPPGPISCTPQGRCFVSGVCNSGECLPTVAVTCSVCQACDPTDGECKTVVDGTPVSSADPCGDVCVGGSPQIRQGCGECEICEVVTGTCAPTTGGACSVGTCCHGDCCATGNCCANGDCAAVCVAPYVFDPERCACVCPPEAECCQHADCGACGVCTDGACRALACEECEVCNVERGTCDPATGDACTLEGGATGNGVCCDGVCCPAGEECISGFCGIRCEPECGVCEACDIGVGRCVLKPDGQTCGPPDGGVSQTCCDGECLLTNFCCGLTNCLPGEDCVGGVCLPITCPACQTLDVGTETCVPNPNGASCAAGAGSCCGGACCLTGNCCAVGACFATCLAPRVFDPEACACVCPDGATPCGVTCCDEGTVCADEGSGACCASCTNGSPPGPDCSCCEAGETLCDDGSCCGACGACQPSGGCQATSGDACGDGICCNGECCPNANCCTGGGCGPACEAPLTFNPDLCACVCPTECCADTACEAGERCGAGGVCEPVTCPTCQVYDTTAGDCVSASNGLSCVSEFNDLGACCGGVCCIQGLSCLSDVCCESAFVCDGVCCERCQTCQGGACVQVGDGTQCGFFNGSRYICCDGVCCEENSCNAGFCGLPLPF